jgi:hypothetical protein
LVQHLTDTTPGQDGTNLFVEWYQILSVSPEGLCWTVGLAIAFLVCCAVFDARTLYLDKDDAGLAWFLRPQSASISSEIWFNFCTRTMVMRIFFTYPGHTVYSKLQLAHVLASSLSTSALFVCVFESGRADGPCGSDTGASGIAFLATVCGSLLTVSGRLAFKSADLNGPAYAIYKANKKARHAVDGAQSLAAAAKTPASSSSFTPSCSGAAAAISRSWYQFQRLFNPGQGRATEVDDDPQSGKSSSGKQEDESPPPPSPPLPLSPPPSPPEEEVDHFPGVKDAVRKYVRTVEEGNDAPTPRRRRQPGTPVRAPGRVASAARSIRSTLTQQWERLWAGGQAAAPPLRLSAEATISDGGPRRILSGRKAGRPVTRGFRVRTLKLNAAQLVAHVDRTAAQCSTYGFRLKLRNTQAAGSSDAGAKACGGDEAVAFVPAQRIGWAAPQFECGDASLRDPRRFAVTYAVSELPAGTILQQVTPLAVEFQSSSSRQRTPPFAFVCYRWLALAWVYNVCLMWGTYLWTLKVYFTQVEYSRTIGDDAHLDAWVQSVLTAFFVSAAYSMLLVDMIKVLCLSLTSPTALAGYGFDHLLPHSRAGARSRKAKLCEWSRAEWRSALKEVARHALRRLHKILDLLG